MTDSSNARIPRAYVIAAVGIIVSLIFSLVSIVYSSSVSSAKESIAQQQEQIDKVQTKNDQQDAAITKLLESQASLSATLTSVLPAINSRLDRIDRKLP